MDRMTEITTEMFLENTTEFLARVRELDCIKDLAARQPKTIAAGLQRADRGGYSNFVDATFGPQ